MKEIEYRERLKNREMPRRRPDFRSGVAGAEAAKLKKFSDGGGSQNLRLSDAGRTDSSITSGISPFPQIGIEIQIQDGLIFSTRLSLADHFSAIINGKESNLLFKWLEQYTKGISSPIPLPFKRELLTPFQDEVHLALKEVPLGKTISYRDLGEATGRVKAARAVGGACNKNPFPLLIPCHRVISANGKIGGFAIDLEIKRRLLEFEGKYKPCPQQ